MSQDPWMPVAIDEAEARAILSLSQGGATSEQQVRAYKAIVYKIAAIYDLAFRPGGVEGDRATAFASGRQFVGHQIEKFVKVPHEVLFPSKPAEDLPTTVAEREKSKRRT